MAIWLFFVIVPLAEIFVFLTVGDEIGIVNTLLLCVLTAIIGGALVRIQGLQTLIKGQAALREGIMPTQEIFDGFCLLAAGAMLVIPGFVTDAMGFTLLIPTARRFFKDWLIRHYGGRFHVKTGDPSRPGRAGDIIEGDFERVDPDDTPQDPPPGRLH